MTKTKITSFHMPKSDRHKYCIAIVANMSAGKTTLINAILGQEVLLSRNESCTFNTYKIKLKPRQKNIRGRIAGEKFTPISISKLQEWNIASCDLVDITGSPFLPFIVEENDLVIYDTKGPNYSLDTSKTPCFGLKKRHVDMLVCVLDYRFLNTSDEYRLLSNVKRFLSNRKNTRLVFFLNQTDTFTGHDASLLECLRRTRKKMKKMHFSDFVIIFGSAYQSLLIRQARQNLLDLDWDQINFETISSKHSFLETEYKKLYSKENLSYLPAFLKKYEHFYTAFEEMSEDGSNLAPKRKNLRELERTAGILMLENIIFEEMEKCRQR